MKRRVFISHILMSKRSASRSPSPSPPRLEKKQKTINDELPNGRYRVVQSSYRYKPPIMRRVVRSGPGWLVGNYWQSSKPKSGKPRLSCPGLPPRGIVQIKRSGTGSRCFRCIGQMEDRWESLHAPYFVQDNQDRIMFFTVDQCRKNDNIFCVQIEFNLNGPMEFTTGTVLRLIQEDDEPEDNEPEDDEPEDDEPEDDEPKILK